MEVECYTFYVKPYNKHKCIETINSTSASAQICFYFWHYQWRQQPQASFWWGKLSKHWPSLTFQIRSVKLTSKNENRGEVNLAMNAVLPHCPCKKPVLGCSCFSDTKLAFLHKHVGATEWKSWDWEGREYCPSSLPCGLVQWGTAVQNSTYYHMNQPPQNNCLELAEASSTGVGVTWLCSCFLAIQECRSTMSWKTLPWKQERAGTWAPEGSAWLPFTRVGGWRGKSCTGESEQAAGCHPALCFLPSG